ncbi:unnamed protein product [Periconia digitata]|uniref:Uncharacterized protein n=1 Tax=Periconia digitata TaxID=1303443 RepID=A0A9W4UPR2_9PLEO|nr:unnamed protein product [Periconia digitata]
MSRCYQNDRRPCSAGRRTGSRKVPRRCYYHWPLWSRYLRQPLSINVRDDVAQNHCSLTEFWFCLNLRNLCTESQVSRKRSDLSIGSQPPSIASGHCVVEQPAPIQPRTTRSDVFQVFEVSSRHTTRDWSAIDEGG